jgi:hypothetical protein
MNDEPDPIPTTHDAGSMGATFAIGGKALNPLSHGHRNAFFRIAAGTRGDETNIVLLYVLTKTKRDVHDVRGDKQIHDFIFDATEWAEKFPIAEITRVADSIWTDYEKAVSVEPDTKDAAPGNA